MQTSLATTHQLRHGGSHLEAHLRSALEVQLKRLRKNWSFAEAESPVEAVHDLRVATRRLRAFSDVIAHALGAKAAHRFVRRLRKVTRALGELRNADVLIGLVEQYLARTHGDRERASLEHFLECLAYERCHAERAARKDLSAIDPSALQADIRSAFEAAMRVASETNVSWDLFGRFLVEQRTQDAIDRAPDGAQLDDAELHRLRIAVKKLRYSMELFEPALEPKTAKCHARALVVQSFLGEHHDLVVLSEHVEKTLKDLQSRKRRLLSSGLAKLLTGLRSERDHLVQRYARERLES
jgi:CHAD domain-containing protein